MKYPANLPLCLQELHLRDIRFDLAKEILLSMPDLMNETASTLSAQACAIATAFDACADSPAAGEDTEAALAHLHAGKGWPHARS